MVRGNVFSWYSRLIARRNRNTENIREGMENNPSTTNAELNRESTTTPTSNELDASMESLISINDNAQLVAGSNLETEQRECYNEPLRPSLIGSLEVFVEGTCNPSSSTGANSLNRLNTAEPMTSRPTLLPTRFLRLNTVSEQRLTGVVEQQTTDLEQQLTGVEQLTTDMEDRTTDAEQLQIDAEQFITDTEQTTETEQQTTETEQQVTETEHQSSEMEQLTADAEELSTDTDELTIVTNEEVPITSELASINSEPETQSFFFNDNVIPSAPQIDSLVNVSLFTNNQVLLTDIGITPPTATAVSTPTSASTPTANEQERVQEVVATLSPSLRNLEIEAMGSVFREVFICPICQSEYCIDTGDPRTLRCGHSLCSNCLEKLYNSENNTVECAECRKSYTYLLMMDIPITFTIKQIIAKYKEKKHELDNPRTINENLVIEANTEENVDPLQSFRLGNCLEHSLPLHFGCTVCEKWLCGTCVCLNHSGNNGKLCKVYQIIEALQRKKNMMLEDLSKKRETLVLNKLEEYQYQEAAQIMSEQATELSEICQKYVEELKAEKHIREEQLKVHKNYDQFISNHISKITSSDNPSEIKQAIDQYLEQKSSQQNSQATTRLIDIWRFSIYDAMKCLKKQSSFLMKRKDRDGLQRWVVVKTENTNVNLCFKNNDYNPRSGSIRNVPLLNLEKHSYFAYITLGSKSDDEYAVISFLVDDNCLGDVFLRKCSDENNSFKGARLIVPGRSSTCLCFGEKSYHSTKKIINLGDKKQYRKPLLPGSIGIFNSFENSNEIDFNNMLIYINMLDSTSPRPHSNIHYVSYEDELKLKLSFGTVYEGFEDLESILNEPEEQYKITDSGIRVHFSGD